jgi:hypothetical protein
VVLVLLVEILSDNGVILCGKRLDLRHPSSNKRGKPARLFFSARSHQTSAFCPQLRYCPREQIAQIIALRMFIYVV